MKERVYKASLGVSLPIKQIEELRQLCEEKRVPISWVVEYAIERLLKEARDGKLGSEEPDVSTR
jgi:hypothetical protein